MAKLSTINYVEIAWLFASLFLGSVLYEQHWGDNFLINIAIVAAVASPLLVIRMLRASALSKRQQVVVSYAYVAILTFWSLTLLNDSYSGWEAFIPAASAAFYLVLRWLRSSD